MLIAVYAILTLILLAAAVSDLRTGKVPNRLTYPAILLGMALWAAIGLYEGGLAGMGDRLGHSALAAIVAFAAFAVVFAMGGLGGGDVKLMAVFGAFVADLNCLLVGTIHAFVIGLLLALWAMIRAKLVKRTLGRLWFAILMFGARLKHDMPTDSPRIPFALAICIGGLLAAAECLLGVRWAWSG